MTIKELSQLYWLKKEEAGLQRRISELRAAAMNPTGSISGGVRGSGSEGKMERLVQEIVELEAFLEDKHIEVVRERKRLEAYIASVPDSYLRQIMRLRFVDGLNWHRVSAKMGGTTADACRKMVRRYLQKN